jgi:uncharacterized iron-regulated membrane protein
MTPGIAGAGAGRQRARRWWLRVHRWIGVAAAVLFLLIAVSGMLLAAKKPLLRWEIGAAALDGRHLDAPTASDASLRAAAMRAYPQFARVMGTAPPHGGFFDSDNATVFGQLAGQRGMAVAMIDPYDASPRAFFVYDGLWMAKIVAVHRSLLLPPVLGGPAMALLGGFLSISLATGLWLWWPRQPGQWRAKLAPTAGSRGLRRILELHQLSLWLLPPLLLIAVSGVYLSLPSLFAGGGHARGGGLARWMASIHGQLSIGATGRVLVFLSGAALATLCVTGLLIWMRKRRSGNPARTSGLPV